MKDQVGVSGMLRAPKATEGLVKALSKVTLVCRQDTSCCADKVQPQNC